MSQPLVTSNVGGKFPFLEYMNFNSFKASHIFLSVNNQYNLSPPAFNSKITWFLVSSGTIVARLFYPRRHSTQVWSSESKKKGWTTLYISTVSSYSFSYVVVHSFPSWLVCGRNQMYCAYLSAQTVLTVLVN